MYFFARVCACSGVFSPLARELILAGSPTLWSFKGRCYYPDLAIKAGDWMPHSTLSFKDKRTGTPCVLLRPRNKHARGGKTHPNRKLN